MHVMLLGAVLVLSYLDNYISETRPTKPFTTNSSSFAVCKGDIVRFPSISKKECTSPMSDLKLASGQTILDSKGRFVKDGLQWIINGVQEQDEGLYINRLLCHERIKDQQTTLKVNCKRLSANSGTRKTLHFSVPNALRSTDDLKLDAITYCTKNGNKPPFKLLVGGTMTKDAKNYFGKRIPLPDFSKENTLILTDVRDENAGNYTAIWSGTIGQNKITRQFTVVLNVHKVPIFPFSTAAPYVPVNHDQNTSYTASNGGVLSTGKPLSGGVKLIVNVLRLFVCILAGISAN